MLAALLLLAPLGTVTLAAASQPATKGGATLRTQLADPADTTITEAEEEAEAEEEEAAEGEEGEAAESEAGEFEEEAEAEEEEQEEEEVEAAGATAKHHDTDGSTKVSKLVLTQPSKGALMHEDPAPSKVHFSFALSSKSKVRFTLARHVDRGGASSWRTLSSVSTAAASGAKSAHLPGGGKLAAGQYRLTLTASDGHAAQLTFAVK